MFRAIAEIVKPACNRQFFLEPTDWISAGLLRSQVRQNERGNWVPICRQIHEPFPIVEQFDRREAEV